MKFRILFFVVSSWFALTAVPVSLADTVPEPETDTILSPVLSPINLRLMGVCEFGFVASDSKFFHKFPAAFRRSFPENPDDEAESTLQFGFEELTLVFDGNFGSRDAGFHGALLVTGSGSEPETLPVPALLEAWGFYRLSVIQFSAGRVRNPFGGRFSDLPEYHLHAVDYRRFRGDGLRIDFDISAGNFHFNPSLAVLERNPEDKLFFYSGRLGFAYHIESFGVISLGASFQYGEDRLRITSPPSASWWEDTDGDGVGDTRQGIAPFDERYSVRRLDFGFDLSVIWRHARDSFFGDTALHAEFIRGSYDDSAFADEDDPVNPQPFIGERKPLGWWVEFSQWFNYGAGGGPFVAFGYHDRRVLGDSDFARWGIGEQGIVRELVVGYRQSIVRGFNVDVELWIVDDGKKLDTRNGLPGAPDFNNDGNSDLLQGNFFKLRFQFIF